jgi:ribonuclease P protein component
MYYWTEPEEVPVKVLFSVSKRNFRRAVHRNRIRRLMREAWRRHQKPIWELSAHKQKTIHIALVFLRREMPDFASIENKIIQLIHRLTSLDETVA